MKNEKYIIAGASHVNGLNQLLAVRVLPPISSKDYILGIPAVPLFSLEIKDYIAKNAEEVDHIFLMVSDFRYGNYYLLKHEKFENIFVSHKDYDAKYNGVPSDGFAPMQKNLISSENDRILYENALSVLDYYQDIYKEKISFIFWDLYVRETFNINNHKYTKEGIYQHPLWNYNDLTNKYKSNVLDIGQFGSKINEYTYDQQGHPSFKGYYFLWHMFRLKNAKSAFQISESRFNNSWSNMFLLQNNANNESNEFDKYKKISFPFNVYAFLSYFQSGDFKELHYGLFKNDSDDMIKAQKNSTDLLFRYLYKSPAKLLEVGIGLGVTHQKLINKGFICTGITPDAAQIDIVNEKIENVDLICTRFEDYSPENKLYNILLFQESSQSIQDKNLFEKAYQLLDENGQILILDEFSIGTGNLHKIGKFQSMAKESGFDVIECLDLSSQAEPTEDYILNNLRKYKTELCQTLQLKESMIDYLLDAVKEHKVGYAKNERGYFFLKLKKSRTIRLKIQLKNTSSSSN